MSVRCYAIGCIQTASGRLCYMSQLINSWSVARQGLWLRVLCFRATIKGPNNVKCTQGIISC